MVGFKDHEDKWYAREAKSLKDNDKWKHGRQKLFLLDANLRFMEFESRKQYERKLKNLSCLRPNYTGDQKFYTERRHWNRMYPNWANYRELHMYGKIL